MIDATTRLNGVIKQFEAEQPAFTSFVYAELESAISFSQSKNDGVVFELEHNPWDIAGLRNSLQFMLNRRQIAASGSLAPKVTPMARIPASGDEKNQWFAKQALDLGCYGIVWPRISTVDQAYHAVASCRYARLADSPGYHPAGLRGDGPMAAARYWGLTQQEYYKKADVWPLSPEGEILVILMIEDLQGVANLDDILSQVPGIGVCLFGEGDFSQEVGVPRQYEHPRVLEALYKVRDICQKHGVAVGHPHVNSGNVERLIGEGFNFLMTFPLRDFSALDKGLVYSGRAG